MDIINTSSQDEKSQNNSQSSEIEIKTEKLEGTPFLMKWTKEEGYSFGIGNYRISPWYKTEGELKKEVKKIDYNTINGMIAAMIDGTLRMYNLIKTEQ